MQVPNLDIAGNVTRPRRGSRLFSPRRRNLKSSNGRLKISPHKRRASKSVINDSMTYFAIYSAHASKFENMNPQIASLMTGRLQELNVERRSSDNVAQMFDMKLPRSNYIAFYGPFSRMFDILAALEATGLIRRCKFTSVNRYEHQGETLLILNMSASIGRESSDPKRKLIMDDPELTEAQKIEKIRQKYAKFLQSNSNVKGEDIDVAINKMLSPRRDR